jgi:hypothetical protein
MAEENIEILTKLVTDSMTPEPVKIQILQKFIDAKKDMPFFDSMIEYDLDFGACPKCGHENWWLTPEEELNKRNVVSSERDPRVKAFTTEADCASFREACSKKKTMF